MRVEERELSKKLFKYHLIGFTYYLRNSTFPFSTPIYRDNENVVALIYNLGLHSDTKHMTLDHTAFSKSTILLNQ